jgi:hypothetical protein
MLLVGLLIGLAQAPATAPEVVPLEAPKYGVRAMLPADWDVAVRERGEYIFVARVPGPQPDRPGACAGEIGVAPQSLQEYRDRIDGNARQGRRPGKLVRNEVVRDNQGEHLETVWEFEPPGAGLWRERSVRRVANRQLYTFILNADQAIWDEASRRFDAFLASVQLDPPNTGADRAPGDGNRWIQREFRFAIALPPDWAPVLAPDEVALLFANAPATGVWADNLVVVGHERRPIDLERLLAEIPAGLRAVEPNCEVLLCQVVRQGQVDALETVVRTQRGPFSMTVIERRFALDRFNYEVKFTVESQRFDALAPLLRQCLDSFQEVPGAVAPRGGKPA